MKPLIISHSDTNGGADRAAYRLHTALRNKGVDSRMRVRVKNTDDTSVLDASNKFHRLFDSLRKPLGQIPMRLQKTVNTNYHSANYLPSNWAKEINSSDADVVNLHWIAGETISIRDIKKIRKPIVWTFHDMWPFCGAEHYAEETMTSRWLTGYRKNNRSDKDSGVDIDRLVWAKKEHCFKQDMYIVSPSRWLSSCAQKSALFRDYMCTVIPNVLDTSVYKPVDKDFCREVLNLPGDRKIILFGAHAVINDPRKGFDLFMQSMHELLKEKDSSEYLVVIFGQSKPDTPLEYNFETKWMGFANDDPTLAIMYNAADVMVVPSRQEAFGQTASEALSCGCPVVGFNCTGLKDVVLHRESGYLANPFDVSDMAYGIQWVLEDASRKRLLGERGRSYALKQWSYDATIPKYLDLYNEVSS